MSSSKAFFRFAAALGVLAIAAPVFGQEPAADPQQVKAACASGFEQSQVLRRAGKLRDSRAELLKCVQYECARPVREQCGVWLEEVERATPSIIVQATVDGDDRSDVGIELDGKKLPEGATGMSFELDPGAHKLKFTCDAFPPIEKSIVLREGEKLRPIQVAFKTPKAEPAPAAAPPPTPLAPPPPVRMERPVPVITYVLGGVAILGGGGLAFFGLSGERRRKQLEDECAPYCVSKDVEPVETYLLLANVSMGVGAAGLAGALISYLARPEKAVDSAGLRVNVALAPGSVGTTATLKF